MCGLGMRLIYHDKKWLLTECKKTFNNSWKCSFKTFMQMPETFINLTIFYKTFTNVRNWPPQNIQKCQKCSSIQQSSRKPSQMSNVQKFNHLLEKLHKCQKHSTIFQKTFTNVRNWPILHKTFRNSRNVHKFNHPLK